MENISAGAVPKVDPSKLQALFQKTKGDDRTAPIATVLTLAGPGGDLLATSLLQEPIPVAEACVSLLQAGAPLDVVLRAAKVLITYPDKDVRIWLLDAAQKALADALDFLAPASAYIGVAAVLGHGLGTDSLARDLRDCTSIQKASKTNVTWLLNEHGDPDFIPFCQFICNKDPLLKKLPDLVTAARSKNMLLKSVGSWFFSATPIDTIIAAVNATPLSCLGCPSYVILHLNLNAKPEAASLLVVAQAEARLCDLGAGAGINLLQADVEYQGGLAAQYAKGRTGPRTGFITAPVANWEIHTHWYRSEMMLTSMHVQGQGANGIELNQWKSFFPRLIARAVALHQLNGFLL